MMWESFGSINAWGLSSFRLYWYLILSYPLIYTLSSLKLLTLTMFSVKSAVLCLAAVLGTQVHGVAAVCASGQMGRCQLFGCVRILVD
jgi:hypothetical protein